MFHMKHNIKNDEKIKRKGNRIIMFHMKHYIDYNNKKCYNKAYERKVKYK